MEILAAIAAFSACVCAWALVSYERELRRMARFLERRERGGNERVAVEFPMPGIELLARVVNAQLDSQRDEAVREACRREQFQRDLASLSHDIRTPLAGAQGYLQLFDRAQGDAAEQKRCVREAGSRLADMRALTEQLFAYAKAAEAAESLDIAPVSVLPILAEELAGLYPAFSAEGRAVEVDFEDEGMEAPADAEALSRIFGNLVANALSHGEGDVRVEQRGRAITFSNAVESPGSIDASRLFERFYRADAARTKAGSGLGLAIVAHLAEAMGARVSARIEGSRLFIELEFPEIAQAKTSLADARTRGEVRRLPGN